MVVGYHLIWTAYGWWLPNDPRGSTSHEIRVEKIEELGELHHGLTQALRCAFDGAAFVNQPLQFHIEMKAALAVGTGNQVLLYNGDFLNAEFPVDI